ncbi:MAG TPA: L,D-transpeptidase family protein [Vicinamibacteria bacterium]|nr:L,D-transpeptidase family protein [Vicinamibacteria bacterium]
MTRNAAIGASSAIVVALLVAAIWRSQPLAKDVVADRVELSKRTRTLRLYAGDRVLKEYRVALGGNPIGHKQREGDERTPEGTYTLDYRNEKSAFHRSIHVSYPSTTDQKQASVAGVDPGGMIMVHGLPNYIGWVGRFHRLVDWTDGCIAVTNLEIDEVWNAVPNGTLIEIEP